MRKNLLSPSGNSLRRMESFFPVFDRWIICHPINKFNMIRSLPKLLCLNGLFRSCQGNAKFQTTNAAPPRQSAAINGWVEYILVDINFYWT